MFDSSSLAEMGIDSTKMDFSGQEAYVLCPMSCKATRGMHGSPADAAHGSANRWGGNDS